MKQIQIDFDLFLEFYDYFFGENAPNNFQADEIRKQMNEKIEKMSSRELFTKYKRTPTGEEREQARKEYLDHKGIMKSFRSEKECPNPEPPV